MQNVWTDKDGGQYTLNRNRLLRGPDCSYYKILEGTEDIADKAFSHREALLRVEIPDTVISMGTSVFRDCCSLESCTIPESLTEISSGTFINCTSLKNVSLPDSLIHIMAGAFHRCTSLKRIVIPENVKFIGIPAFSGCKCEIIYLGTRYQVIDKALYGYDGVCMMHCPADAITIKIPNTVGNIARNAFCMCSDLEEITFPRFVINLDQYTFSTCPSLKRIFIPKGAKDDFAKCIPKQKEILIEI